MVVVEGSHWIQEEGNQVVAVSKARQEAEKDLRTRGVRQGSRSVGEREASRSREIFPQVAREKAEEQMWWVGESLTAVTEVSCLS